MIPLEVTLVSIDVAADIVGTHAEALARVISLGEG